MLVGELAVHPLEVNRKVLLLCLRLLAQQSPDMGLIHFLPPIRQDPFALALGDYTPGRVPVTADPLTDL